MLMGSDDEFCADQDPIEHLAEMSPCDLMALPFVTP